MEQVFINYSAEDYEIAKQLYDDLSRFGVKPWINRFDIVPGQEWQKTIKNAIENSSYFLALLSKNVGSRQGFVNAELKFAFNVLSTLPPDEIFIIPVRLDDSDPVHNGFAELHWVDLFPSYKDGLISILRIFRIAIEKKYEKLSKCAQ